jgi:hypothetical protein
MQEICVTGNGIIVDENFMNRRLVREYQSSTSLALVGSLAFKEKLW